MSLPLLLPLLHMALGLSAPLRLPGPLSARPASYAISARLDEARLDVSADETLTWRNDASGPATELAFHLYMNAFKNDASTYFRETQERPAPGSWGYIEASDVKVRYAGGAWAPATLVVPPVGDQTLARLPLPRPIAPGETIEVSMHFVTHLPAVIARAGHHQGFYAVAQWFPKIAVFRCDPACAFVADAYHGSSEFFADFGAYDVRLDLPARLVVGATGVLTEEQSDGERRHLRYQAEDVHDFAFAADARFIRHELEVIDDPALPPVHVLLLGERSLADNVPRHLASIEVGLRELGRRLGPYPYRQLTVVQVPAGAEEASGMEYPTLFFTADMPSPKGVFYPELVSAHELAHSWFQGMVASDEVNEAWLDEGFTELATSWVLAAQTPPIAMVWDRWGHHLTYRNSERYRLLDERDDPIAQPAHAFRDHRAYAQNTYRKTSLLLQTIAERIGAVAFQAAFHAYFDRHRFTHPRRADAIRMFTGLDVVLARFMAEALDRPGGADYAVTSVATKPERATEGWVDREGVRTEVRAPPATGTHLSEITVARRGALSLPVTVRARFADGTTVDAPVPLERDARRWQRVELRSNSALVEAELHPADDLPLDMARWNDGLRVSSDPKPRVRVVSSLQLIAALLLSWFGR